MEYHKSIPHIEHYLIVKQMHRLYVIKQLPHEIEYAHYSYLRYIIKVFIFTKRTAAILVVQAKLYALLTGRVE